MKIATIEVSGVRAAAGEHTMIPAGITGASVSFDFTDPRWEYRYRYGMSIELHPHNARITLYREGHPVETFCYM